MRFPQTAQHFFEPFPCFPERFPELEFEDSGAPPPEDVMPVAVVTPLVDAGIL